MAVKSKTPRPRPHPKKGGSYLLEEGELVRKAWTKPPEPKAQDASTKVDSAPDRSGEKA